MISPVIAEKMAEIRTIPADKSFIYLIFSLYSSEIRLHTSSVKVFISSLIKTVEMQNSRIINSVVLTLNINEKRATINVIKIWKRKFISRLKHSFIPFDAHIKLLKKFFFDFKDFTNTFQSWIFIYYIICVFFV